MKIENVKQRISNFFSDTENEKLRKKYIDFCFAKFERLKKCNPKTCDSELIKIAISITITEFGL